MASDLFPFDGSFFSDQFSPFMDPIDILQELENNPIQENQIDEISCLDQIASTLLSNSPPSRQLENLSLYQTPSHLGNSQDFNSMEVKTEECQFPCFYSSSYDYNNNGNSFMMQRSYSSNSFDGRKSGFLFQPGFGSLMEESHSFQSQVLSSSPEDGFFSDQVRRVCSTGDLQNIKTSSSQTKQRLSSSPLATESSLIMNEDPNSKVGRYSAEERKERIHRYRAKRNHRNFNKTIKYACRKTLADNRPRIRGRFARNDEAPGDISKAATFNRYEDEDDLWIEGLHEEDEEGRMRRGGALFNNYGPTQFQYYGYDNGSYSCGGGLL
ncbi:hypothetical protein LguiA_034346 [Lonicera macranthoides]